MLFLHLDFIINPSDYLYLSTALHHVASSDLNVNRFEVHLVFEELSRRSLHLPTCYCRKTASHVSNMSLDFHEFLHQLQGISDTFLKFMKWRKVDAASVTIFTGHS